MFTNSALVHVWDVFGNGCIGCKTVFSEVSDGMALGASIDSARSTGMREILVCMELPVSFEGVLDCRVVAVKFLANSPIRPVKIDKLEDSPAFRGCKWSI